MSEFVSADLEIVANFMTKSQELITEFDNIKKEYERINEELLKDWEGHGADAYKKETDHILENIGGIKDVLDGINNGVLNDIKNQYDKLDEELGEFNQNPPTSDEG